MLTQWQTAYRRKVRRQERCNLAAGRLQAAISGLILFAQSQEKPWGLSKLAAKIEIPARTLRRIRDQKVDPLIWLPKVEAALARLKAG